VRNAALFSGFRLSQFHKGGGRRGREKGARAPLPADQDRFNLRCDGSGFGKKKGEETSERKKKRPLPCSACDRLHTQAQCRGGGRRGKGGGEFGPRPSPLPYPFLSIISAVPYVAILRSGRKGGLREEEGEYGKAFSNFIPPVILSVILNKSIISCQWERKRKRKVLRLRPPPFISYLLVLPSLWPSGRPGGSREENILEKERGKKKGAEIFYLFVRHLCEKGLERERKKERDTAVTTFLSEKKKEGGWPITAK